jgi:ubiquinone/menaquinone biosynthesis C-methylase UbiE
MSTLPGEFTAISPWSGHLELLHCPRCGGGLVSTDSRLSCAGCETAFPIRDGILIVKEQADDNNRVAQEFYDSALWPRFRFWEKFTWFCNGGERRARNQVLKHLPRHERLNLLDVAVGDGVYLPWMPADWQVVGIDVSWSQLNACRARVGGPSLRLVQGEAETLPFHDAQFDAVLSIGAFNYFNDPEGALREMVRVARPGAAIVISDEMPNLTDRMLGHKLGLPSLDRWIVSRLMHLGDSFTDMVERLRTLDVRSIAERVLPEIRYHEVWHGLGYVLVGLAPG